MATGDGNIDLRKRRGGVLSSSEKITGAKNAQADMLLQRLLQQLQQDLRKLMSFQQGASYLVEHELKLLHLDRKCSELSEHRRLYPDADHSHEESVIRNLSKYLVQTTGTTSYTDKRLSHKLRTQAQPDSKTPVVAKAQAKLRQQSYDRALQVALAAAAAAAASSAGSQSDGAPDAGSGTLPGKKAAGGDPGAELDVSDSDETEDEGADATGRRRVAGASRKQAPTTHPSHRSGFFAPQRVQVHDPGNRPAAPSASELHAAGGERAKGAAALSEVWSGQSSPASCGGRSPPTQAAMRECLHRVNKQVIEFCESIDSKVWRRKEEDFNQALKYVKDKEKAWSGFMEEMQKRQRVRQAREEEMKAEESLAAAEHERQLSSGSAVSVRRLPLSAAAKKKLLLENILPARACSHAIDSGAHRHRRGVPWHSAERSNKHSPSVKLQMILDRTRGSTAPAKEENEAAPPAAIAAA